MEQPTLGPPAEEPATRPPLSLWDRIKFVLLFVGVFAVLTWSTYIDIQIVGGSLIDAFQERLGDSTIWLFLAWLEVIRQLHYLMSERWVGWHRFWSQAVFGRFNRRVERFDDWNRYRLARAAKWLAFAAVGIYVLSQIYDVPFAQAAFELPHALWTAMPFVVQLVFIMFLAVSQFIAIFWFMSRGGVETYMPRDVRTRFSDVWGQDAVLERVKENLVFLENPEAIEAKGGYVPGGILLWGPPGTGKTLLAESAAGETGKPFVFVEPGAFQAMFMGVGIMKVKALFRKIRKLALRYGGVVVFFDEADALGNRGALAQGGWNASATDAWHTATACNGLAYQPASIASLLSPAAANGPSAIDATERRGLVARVFVGGLGGGGGMGTLQALLAEMQGLKKPRGFFNRIVRRTLGMRPKPPPKYRILFIMATNMPQSLDEALLRPGRIDRIYKMGYPTKEGRRRTFEGYLSKVQHELTDAQIDKLSVISRYATGATIKDMVNEALVIAIRNERDTVTWPDILRAKQLKEHGLPDDSEYVERERHAVAIHEACHAIASYRLRSHELIDIATIERRGDVGGFVSSIPPEDLFMEWRSERDTDVMVFLASLAGERLFFGGDNSTGVTGDLRSATAIALMMEGYWGMGDTVASRLSNLGMLRGAAPQLEDGTDRAVFDTPFGERVEARLRQLFEDVEQLLTDNRVHVLAVAHALEEHKTISGEDVAAIIEGEVGPAVDGRLYVGDAAVELLEAYHESSVVAHDTHGRPSIELPVLAELTFAAASTNGGNGSGNGRTNGSRRRRRAAAEQA